MGNEVSAGTLHWQAKHSIEEVLQKEICLIASNPTIFKHTWPDRFSHKMSYGSASLLHNLRDPPCLFAGTTMTLHFRPIYQDILRGLAQSSRTGFPLTPSTLWEECEALSAEATTLESGSTQMPPVGKSSLDRQPKRWSTGGSVR